MENQYEIGETWYNKYTDRTYIFKGDYWEELADERWETGVKLPLSAHPDYPTDWKEPFLITDNFKYTDFKMLEPEFVGKMPPRREIEIIPADRPKKKKLGWYVEEIVGISIVNPGAVKAFEAQRESSDAFWAGLEGRL